MLRDPKSKTGSELCQTELCRNISVIIHLIKYKMLNETIYPRLKEDLHKRFSVDLQQLYLLACGLLKSTTATFVLLTFRIFNVKPCARLSTQFWQACSLLVVIKPSTNVSSVNLRIEMEISVSETRGTAPRLSHLRSNGEEVVVPVAQWDVQFSGPRLCGRTFMQIRLLLSRRKE